MNISFDNVSIIAPGGQRVLSNVSGVCTQGKLTSLMGASGSGKTSLLSALARRFEPTLKYTGTVLYGGVEFNLKRHGRRSIAFVRQDDIVPEYLTVFEFLEFSGKLRLAVSPEQLQERIETVIKQLRLEKCRNTKLGGADARGVSGGERKRAAIGNELLTEPKILLTDEPTSGLDSTLAVVVVEILKELALSGLNVLTTIHSPSSAIFDKFDSLLILDEGQVFYQGRAENLITFLQSSSPEVQVPMHFNPADFLMDLLVLDKWRNVKEVIKSQSAAAVKREAIEDEHNLDLDTNNDESISVDALVQATYAQSMFVQTLLLLKRMWRKVGGQLFSKEQILAYAGLSLVSGLLFFQIGYTESEIPFRNALALWLCGTEMYLATFSTALSLHDEIPLAKKELFDGSYSLPAFFLARQFVAFPMIGFWSVVFNIFVLGCSNLAPSVSAAILIMLVMQLGNFMYQGVGFFLSALLPMQTVMVVVIVVVTYFFAFGGFFVPFSVMPDWYRWLRWPCFLVYPYQLTLQLAFPYSSEFSCSSSCSANVSVITGAQVQQLLQVDLSVEACVLTMFISGILFRMAAYFIFQRRMRPAKGLNQKERQMCTRSRWCCCVMSHKKTTLEETPPPPVLKDKETTQIQDV